MDWEKFSYEQKDVKFMESKVKSYSYAEKQIALITDEKVCTMFVLGIREAKSTLFDIIELLFELEKKEPVSKKLQALRDELDVFSDEIKARYCDWRGLPEDWMKKLVEHDVSLIRGLAKFNSELRTMYEGILNDKSLLEEQPQDAMLWEQIMKKIPGFEQAADSLLSSFKEREGLVNLRPMALDKTYELVKRRAALV